MMMDCLDDLQFLVRDLKFNHKRAIRFLCDLYKFSESEASHLLFLLYLSLDDEDEDVNDD